jgi:hypothetical protein
MPHRLDAERIHASAALLVNRIGERFPGSGLLRAAGDVSFVAAEADRRSASIARVHVPLRTVTWGLGGLLTLGLGWAASSIPWAEGYQTASDLVQGVDAAANLVLLLGVAILTTSRWETRLRRRRALAVVHELKALAHVVDMHQLTKRPADDASGVPDTASSPKRSLSTPELVRYLDYCAELLALLGKVAAVYGQRVDDPEVLAATDEVEELTTALARKVWQKIALASRVDAP